MTKLRKVQGSRRNVGSLFITIPVELDEMFRKSEYAIVEILPSDDGFSVRPARIEVDHN